MPREHQSSNEARVESRAIQQDITKEVHMPLHRPDGERVVRRRGAPVARLALLTALLGSLSALPAQAQSLPADVHISFRTTMTAVRSHNPAMLGAVTVFPIKLNLYDSLPANYAFSAFALSPFRIVLPAAAAPVAVSATLEYETGTAGRAELCRFSATLANTPQTVPCTSSAGFAAFAGALQSDIVAGGTAPRVLDKVRFIVTLRLSGAGVPSLASLDFDILFAAVAKTQFTLG
jgi:hypothetical protein